MHLEGFFNQALSCQSMIVLRQLSQQKSLDSEDLREVNDAISQDDHQGVIHAIEEKNLPLWKCVNEDGQETGKGC